MQVLDFEVVEIETLVQSARASRQFDPGVSKLKSVDEIIGEYRERGPGGSKHIGRNREVDQ